MQKIMPCGQKNNSLVKWFLLPDSPCAVEEFKERTARKVRDLRCPDHRRGPRLKFHGASLRDISIQMSACCDKLIVLANQRIAQAPD
jgi:hypothetical protein